MFSAGLGAAVAALTTLATVVAGTVPAHADSGDTIVTATTQKTIQLPGVGGHGDLVVADPGAYRVYVAQSPDNNVVVIDTRTQSVEAIVGNVPGANGIAYSHDYLFVSEGPTNQVAVISKHTWQVIAKVASGGKSPDAIYYDAWDHTVFVANSDSNTMEYFSATEPFTVLGSIPLQPSNPKSGPDLGTYVCETNTIYQADDDNVLVIDASTREIKKVFSLSLPAGGAARGMFYDHNRDVLWVGTNSAASEVLAINPTTGSVLATVATASGMDQIAGDEQRRLLFLGESKAGVMGVVDLDTFTSLADVPTESSTHTLDYLPNTDLVYVYRNMSNVVDVVKIDVKRRGDDQDHG
jgi:YVTN family beta-propeller protein